MKVTLGTPRTDSQVLLESHLLKRVTVYYLPNMGNGLRARWRINAMRTIQESALDLFDARGFDAVTIEEIAAAAEVSPSSVYRYFGTKEGLLVADEFDSMSQETLEGISLIHI